MTKQKYFKIGAILVLVMMLLPSIVFQLLRHEDLKQRNIDNNLRKEIEKANKNLPMMLSKDTRLDKISMPEHLEFERHHTWVNLDASELNDSDKTNFSKEVTAEFCSDKTLRQDLKKRAKVTLVYSSKYDTEMLRFSITENNCLKLKL